MLVELSNIWYAGLVKRLRQEVSIVPSKYFLTMLLNYLSNRSRSGFSGQILFIRFSNNNAMSSNDFNFCGVQSQELLLSSSCVLFLLPPRCNRYRDICEKGYVYHQIFHKVIMSTFDFPEIDEAFSSIVMRNQWTMKPYISKTVLWVANVSFSFDSISFDVDLISCWNADRIISSNRARNFGLTWLKFLFKARVSDFYIRGVASIAAYFIKLRILSNTNGSEIVSEDTSILSTISRVSCLSTASFCNLFHWFEGIWYTIEVNF